MKHLFFLLALFIIVFGCSKNEVTSPHEDNRQPFVIHPLEISKNHYFLDQVYKDPAFNIFQKYFGNRTSIITPYYTVKKIEVWKTINGTSHLSERWAYIANSLRRVIPLTEGKDYLCNRYVGIISLVSPINDSEVLAVAYQIEGNSSSELDDIKYGRFSNEINKELTLKQIKPYHYPGDNLPELQLKNIYSIGNKNISSTNFTFDIYFIAEKNKPANNYQGVKLLQAFGFDSDLDGNFDFVDGKTILSQTGEIIFPSLEPFGDNLPEVFFMKQKDTMVSPYQIKSIYDNSQWYSASDSNVSKYYLYGKYYTK